MLPGQRRPVIAGRGDVLWFAMSPQPGKAVRHFVALGRAALWPEGSRRSRNRHAVLLGYLLGFGRGHVCHLYFAANQFSVAFSRVQNGNQGLAPAAFKHLAFFHDTLPLATSQPPNCGHPHRGYPPNGPLPDRFPSADHQSGSEIGIPGRAQGPRRL